MTQVLDALLSCRTDTFDYFEQVFVFGSSLWSENPNDIDILLVYEAANLDQVNLEKARLAEAIGCKVPDFAFDFTP